MTSGLKKKKSLYLSILKEVTWPLILLPKLKKYQLLEVLRHGNEDEKVETNTQKPCFSTLALMVFLS